MSDAVADGSTAPIDRFEAEARVLDRFAVDAESPLVDVPVLGGQARVLIAGDGPPVVMLIGAGPPAAMWAPLMAELTGFSLCTAELQVGEAGADEGATGRPRRLIAWKAMQRGRVEVVHLVGQEGARRSGSPAPPRRSRAAAP